MLGTMKPTNSIAKAVSHKLKNISRTPLSSSSIPKEKVDCLVIGAGVVGIAVAKELSVKHGREVLVVDSAPTFGTGTSSRNSEVIHAGIYYPPNSLKVLLPFNFLPRFFFLYAYPIKH